MDLVAVDNLVKRYNEVVALDHFDLHIEPGEIFGLLGPNGSGKTTAINCILQLLTYDKGTIRAVRRAHDALALRPQAPHRRGAAERGGLRRAHGAREHRLASARST